MAQIHQEFQILNGVSINQLKETMTSIEKKPNLAKCQFRAKNQWFDGGYSRSTIKDFYASGKEDQSRAKPFLLDADEPPVLLGENRGVNPVEYVLEALAACLTASLVYHAAARGVQLYHVESHLEGDLDLQGFLGLSEKVRNGYEGVRVRFFIKGNATEEELKELLDLAQKRSPVFDIISNPVPIQVELKKRIHH